MDSRARLAIDDDAGEGPEPLPPEGALAERYRVLRRLGRGSTGALWSAIDARDGEFVVIKQGSDAEAVRREAEVLAALDHPNVVRLKDRHAAEGSAFLVLEFVDAPDLGAVLARAGGRLDEAMLRPLLLRLADAVEAIHAAGFLHRDLKPANVLIRRDGDPVIVDFAAAAPLDRAAEIAPWSALTDGYAAPEQYLTDQPEGRWTDVYGLGAIAYRAATGGPPPPAPARLRGETMPPSADAAAGCSEALRRAIDWALEPEPSARPRTAGDWKGALAPLAPDAERPLPVATGGEDDLDDYPPTVRVKRVPSRRPAPSAVAPQAEPAPRARWRPARILLAAGLLAVLGAGLATAGWYGWPLYERHVKTRWIVDAAGGGDAVTIADALVRAGAGATIAIRPGTYPESLILDRPVHLMAAVADEAPLIAPEQGPCLVAATRSGSVAGLHLRAAAPAVAEETPAPCLEIAGGGLRVEGNRIASAAGPAILIRGGAAPLILGNTIENGAGPGIVVAEGARGTLAQNAIADVAGAALVLRSGADPDVTDNTFEGRGVVFAEGARGTFARNRIVASEGSAIEVTTGADPLVADNTIEGAGEAGIFVYDLGRGRFEGNTIAGSGLSGVVIAGGGAPRLIENTIRDNGEHGVLVVDRSGGVLERNTVAGNGGHGIALGWDADVEVTDNQLDGNTEPQLLDARDR